MPSNYIAPLAVSVARGSDKTFAWTHQTSGSSTTPIDITGWTITVTIKRAGLTVLTKSASVTSGPAGTYGWSVTHTDTLLDPSPYDIDVWRTDSGAHTLMGLGSFTITSELLY